MEPPPPESVSQPLFGVVLVLLILLGCALLYKNLEQRPPGKSRVDWPAAPSAKP